MGGSIGSMGAVEDRILGMLYGCAIGDSFVFVCVCGVD